LTLYIYKSAQDDLIIPSSKMEKNDSRWLISKESLKKIRKKDGYIWLIDKKSLKN
jgi:hypothetical protein